MRLMRGAGAVAFDTAIGLMCPPARIVTGLQRREAGDHDGVGVDLVLGVELRLRAGLAEAIDAERDAARPERGADECEGVTRAVDHGDDGEAAARREEEQLEVRRASPADLSAAPCGSDCQSR